jgi:hypothetical protein
MSTNCTTKSSSLSNPVQLRLSPVILLGLQAAARARGRSLTDEIRHRLETYERVDLQIQGLRAEIALHGAPGPRADERVLDALLRLQGMIAEVLGFLRRRWSVDVEAAQRDVERHRLPVWGRPNEDR